jgi:hypothetical protein
MGWARVTGASRELWWLNIALSQRPAWLSVEIKDPEYSLLSVNTVYGRNVDTTWRLLGRTRCYKASWMQRQLIHTVRYPRPSCHWKSSSLSSRSGGRQVCRGTGAAKLLLFFSLLQWTNVGPWFNCQILLKLTMSYSPFEVPIQIWSTLWRTLIQSKLSTLNGHLLQGPEELAYWKISGRVQVKFVATAVGRSRKLGPLNNSSNGVSSGLRCLRLIGTNRFRRHWLWHPPPPPQGACSISAYITREILIDSSSWSNEAVHFFTID